MHERLVFDGDCGFCTASAQWLSGNGRVEVVPWQRLPLDIIGLTRDQVTSAAWWLEDDRPVEHSSRAIGRALAARGGLWSPLGRLLLLRPVRPVADGVYRVVARHRHRLPGGTPVCKLP